MSKNFDETARLQSEKRQELIQEVKGERTQKGNGDLGATK